MLYISRYIGLRSFGVVDTDDGVEQVATARDIVEATLNSHLVIQGCSIDEFPTRPWQPQETKTPLQLKTKLLSHVDVVTYKSAVTSIIWKGDKIKLPVTVRVSDFGCDLAEFILRHNNAYLEHKITLVFDDKIRKVVPWSLQPVVSPIPVKKFDRIGVIFDFSEVTNLKLLQSLYDSVRAPVENMRVLTPQELVDSIQDDVGRKWQMLGLP